MKKYILFFFLLNSAGFGQHSDLILKELGSIDMNFTLNHPQLQAKLFSEAYDGCIILHAPPSGGFYECIFTIDPQWNRIIYGRIAYDQNGNVIKWGSFLTGYTFDGWIKSFGSFGRGINQFNYPHGISAVRYDNTRIDVYVADTGNNRIVKLRIDPGTGAVTWVTTYTAGFNQPYDVVVADNNNTDPNDDLIWVADKNNHRIVQLNQNGNVIYSIGSYGYGQGKFSSPVSISIGRNWTQSYSNVVFVAEQGYNMIITFQTGQAPNGYTNWFQYLFPTSGRLTSIESDLAGVGFYVVDNANHRIHKFRYWITNYYLAEYGNFGIDAQQLYYPNSISLEKIIQVGSSYWGGFYGGILEKWTTNTGAKYFQEGVDILNLYATPNSDGSIMNYSYKLPSGWGYVTEVIKNSSGSIVRTLKNNTYTTFCNNSGNWNRTNDNGTLLDPGTYTLEVTAKIWLLSGGTYLDQITKPVTFNLFAPLSVSISGPMSLQKSQTGTWTANVTGGYGFLSYQWYAKPDGSSTWSPLGTAQTQTLGSIYYPTPFTMKVVVSRTNGTAEATKYVTFSGGPPPPEKVSAVRIPEKFSLSNNYPNPFNPTTTIKYALPQSGNVKLEIYNTIGQKVRTLINEYKSEGYYDAVWNGLNDAGNQIASGVYFYRLEITKENSVLFRDLQKMLLLK